MKQTIKIFASLFITLTCALNLTGQTKFIQTNLLEDKEVMSFRPMDIMTKPQTLRKVWIDEPMPLTFYTTEEKKAQKIINQKTTDGIITYSPLSKKNEWTSFDYEEITPFTWKWIDFELKKDDATLTKINLLRPHWWIKELGADSIDKKVYLDMPELGSQGWATVKAIRINQLDTRFWNENRKGDYVSRPITGKFEHESNDVFNLLFGDNPNPLGVTGSHPIWSIDRNNWIGARDLKIGETVKTKDGVVVLKSRTKLEGLQKVYNLEIFKDHNFLVTTDKILVHNSCITGKVSAIAKKYKLFQCKECAGDIVNSLKKDGISGEILDIRTVTSKRGNIWSDKMGGNISENGFHRGVLVEGKVYDNIHTNGIKYDDWIKDFNSVEGFNVTKTQF